MFRNRGWLLLPLLTILSTAPIRAEETLAERRARVEALSPEEKEDLRQKEERFVGLSDNEKERLRKLHTELSSSDDGARLKEVLQRYHAWLATLSSAERAALLSLPPEQRLAKVKEKLRAQEEKQFFELVKANLQPEDRKAIVTWLEAFVDRHQDEILATIPVEFRPKQMDGRSRWQVMFVMLRRWSENDAKMPRPDKTEVEALIATLSPKARQSLESIRDPSAKTKLAQEWIRAAVASRSMPTLPPVDADELRRFYNEELSTTERERLENLPAEEMQLELQKVYYQHRFRRGFGPPRGGPGGPGGPGPSQEGRPPFGNGSGGRGPRDDKGPRDERYRDDKKGPRPEPTTTPEAASSDAPKSRD